MLKFCTEHVMDYIRKEFFWKTTRGKSGKKINPTFYAIYVLRHKQKNAYYWKS